MPKTKISEYSATAADNTDIDGINLGEGMLPSDVNNAIRELMSQIKDLQAGTSGDTIPLTAGGTGATSASTARTALGATTTGNSLFTAVDAAAGRSAITAASSGANSDITSLTGLTTALSVGQGGTGATALTANNVILGNGTSAVNFVAPGTSGNVLVSNGTTWTSASAGGSDWVLIQTQSVTNVSTIDFTSISSAYDSVVLVIHNLIAASGNITPGLRFGTGSTTYQTSSYYHNTLTMETSGSIDSLLGSNVGYIPLRDTSANNNYHSVIYVQNLQQLNSSYPTALFNTRQINSGGTSGLSVFGGAHWNNNTTAITALRIYSASGNNLTGSVSLYGLKD